MRVPVREDGPPGAADSETPAQRNGAGNLAKCGERVTYRLLGAFETQGNGPAADDLRWAILAAFSQ